MKLDFMDNLSQAEKEQLLQLQTRLENLENCHIERAAMGWRGQFDERQRGLIRNCEKYASDNPSGLPGHKLILIVAKMAQLLDGEKKWSDG
jgi:hypothetical protein